MFGTPVRLPVLPDDHLAAETAIVAVFLKFVKRYFSMLLLLRLLLLLQLTLSRRLFSCVRPRGESEKANERNVVFTMIK